MKSGKEIYANIVEYPLPKKAGIKDYIIYFVGENDSYGKGARYFFNKFYPNHEKKNCKSLEDLINFLEGETRNGVIKFREIVIVSHGNSQGMLFPILNDISGTDLKKYKYVYDYTLTCLQLEFQKGKFAQFAEKRKKVTSHLTIDSWITIRACNFGNSVNGMYAFYSFWGGRANVFAPKVYQFFGTQPITEGMKIDSNIEVHEHLFKQRFIPKDIHTPERKDTIVSFFIDKGKFTEPFEVVSMSLENPDPVDKGRYEEIINRLNGRHIHSFLKSKFEAHDFNLTSKAKVEIVVKNLKWKLEDRLIHSGKSFTIIYQVYEQIGFSPSNKQVVKLNAEARLKELLSVHDRFPIQLFFQDSDNDIWKGKLFVLAYYNSKESPESTNNKRFEGFKKLLETLKISDVNYDLKTFFMAEEIDLGPAPTLQIHSQSGTGELIKKEWLIQGNENYLIRLEHPYNSNMGLMHTLVVYDFLDEKNKLLEQYKQMTYLGEDPDTPGTELPSYLNLFSIEELLEFIKFLRTPYKAENVLYIHHAQLAMKRKKDAFKVEIQHINDENLVLEDEHFNLSIGEREDKNDIAYNYDFNTIWQDIKSSYPSEFLFQDDLFLEEDLFKKFEFTEDSFSNQQVANDMDSDSPSANLTDLQTLEMSSFERFFNTDKDMFSAPADDSPDASCEDFKTLIGEINNIKELDSLALEEYLKAKNAPSGENLYDLYKAFLSKYKLLRNLSKAVELGSLPALRALTATDIAKVAIKRIPYLSKFAFLKVIAEVDFIVTIPFEMWKKFVEEGEKSAKVWEAKAKLAAVRQWLKRLITLTYNNFDPNNFSIDLYSNIGISMGFSWDGEPPHIRRYFQDEFDHLLTSTSYPIVFAPDRMKTGFENGIELATNTLWPEILQHADEAIDDLIYEWNLDGCKMNVLTNAGFLDVGQIRTMMIQNIASGVLAKLPNV